jgi:hypothetical protein
MRAGGDSNAQDDARGCLIMASFFSVALPLPPDFSALLEQRTTPTSTSTVYAPYDKANSIHRHFLDCTMTKVTRHTFSVELSEPGVLTSNVDRSFV